LARIINENHFKRLSKLVNDQKNAPGSILLSGGSGEIQDLFLEPTLFQIDAGINNQPIMQSEIFGPILPIIPVNSIDEAIETVRSVTSGDPLSLHVFTKHSAVYEKVFASINCGHAVVNEVLMNAAVEELPFGGVNESGLGSYHGSHSLRAFTREQGFFIRGISHDLINLPKYQHMSGDMNSFTFKVLKLVFEVPLPSNLHLAFLKVFRAVGGFDTIRLFTAFLIGIAGLSTVSNAITQHAAGKILLRFGKLISKSGNFLLALVLKKKH
jgi:delta 1-pyrroline-5-carboxylate dehydrogenase